MIDRIARESLVSACRGGYWRAAHRYEPCAWGLGTQPQIQRTFGDGEQLMGIVWDGIKEAGALNDWALTARCALADAAMAYQWPRVFELISEHREFRQFMSSGREIAVCAVASSRPRCPGC